MPRCPLGHESASSDYCDECGYRIVGAAPSAGETGTPDRPESCPLCGTPRLGRYCETDRFDFVTGMPAEQLPVTPERVSAAGAGITSATAGSTAAASSAVGVAAQDPAAQDPAAQDPAAQSPGGHDPAGHGPAAQSPAGHGPAGHAGHDPAAQSPVVTADGAAWSAVATADRDYFHRVIAEGGPGTVWIPFPSYCPPRRFSLGLAAPGEVRQIGRPSRSRGISPDIDLTGPQTDPGISRLHAVLVGQPDGSWAVMDPGSQNGTMVNGREIPTGVEVPLQDGDRIYLGAWTMITISRE